MSAGTRHYGAKWWKFDFHNHTPKSDDYGKGPEQAALKARSPREWLLDFMNAGMDCVAITDHNSGEWIDLLKQELVKLNAEKPAGYRQMTLFPGVEISVNGGIRTGSMGALQRQEIRRAVCDVVEGGKEALDKRYYRISRALS
jgi:predicted metal-dependent phosphoesterase TrpH